MAWSSRSVRFGVATGLVFIAALVHFYAWEWVSSARFSLFYPAVTVAAWFGGLAPGLMASIFSAVIAQLILEVNTTPGASFTASQLAQLAIFSVHSVILSFLVGHISSRQTLLQERAKALQALEQERKRLEDAVQARDDFLSIASHELRTPLTSLTLQAQLRLRNLAKADTSFFSSEKLTQMLENDVKQLRRLSLLVDDMLDVSRITSGSLPLVRSEVQLCGVLDEVVSRYRALFETAGSVVRKNCAGNISGYWDRTRLEQVFTNLLSNAAKYAAGKPVEVIVEGGVKSARVIIRDQGIGISPENHERIFKRFERAVSATEISGMGLGLYIVRRIVEDHGGTIRVESELGKGAAFIVELPLDSQRDLQLRTEKCKKCRQSALGICDKEVSESPVPTNAN